MSLKFRVATRDFGQASCHSISASFARAIFHWPEAITLRVMGVSDHLHLMIWSVSKNFLNSFRAEKHTSFHDNSNNVTNRLKNVTVECDQII